MSGSGYGRRMTDAKQTEARAELTALADDLGCIARGHDAKSAKLRELLDYALPLAMYAASTEEGDRIRELMREVEL